MNDADNARPDLPEGQTSEITAEQQAEIDRIKRRNMILAAIAGVIMMVLGFFAGQAARERKSGSLEKPPAAAVQIVDSPVAIGGRAGLL